MARGVIVGKHGRIDLTETNSAQSFTPAEMIQP
jgi:hypothetical protein